jgi:ribokinase
MPKIVVVGSLNMDLVVQVPTIPNPGETVLGNNFAMIPGGKGANQAVAAARLGAEVIMIGQVGGDAFGQELIENLKREGIKTEFVSISKNSATGVAMIAVDAQGQNSIAVASGANFTFSSKQLVKAWESIGEIDALIMPLETKEDTIYTAAELAKESKGQVILNPAPARPIDAATMALVDVLIPNEFEAAALAQVEVNSQGDIEKASEALLYLGVDTVITTLGEKGVLLSETNKKATYLQPYEVEVVDTTAAGDGFVAGFAVSITEGNSVYDSVIFANAVGALTVTKAGAQPSLPYRSEVEDFITKKRKDSER